MANGNPLADLHRNDAYPRTEVVGSSSSRSPASPCPREASLTALLLVVLVVAAALHAGYHLLLKSAVDQHLFAWGSLVFGAALFSPLILWGGPWPARIWPYVVASALAEAAYFLILASAYRLADFSLAYPLARGTAPALLTVWAVLWLRERPTLAGITGLGVVVAGLLVVGAARSVAGDVATTSSRGGIGAALLAALLISTYSAIDGAAVRIVPAAPYTALVLAVTAVLMTPAMLWRYPQDRIAGAVRVDWRRMLLVGPMMMISYGLVLFAFSRGSVAYAGAVREISIVFGALAGWRWLGEGLGRRRLAGAALIFAGIVIIALARR